MTPTKRLLLVDDEPELLQALSVRLTAAGFACETAENGLVALQKLAKDPLPDLIVLDLLMPEISGYEVSRRLQESDRWKSIPLLVLTAVPERSMEQAAPLWLGAIAVLHKPFDSSILVATVRRLLQLPEPSPNA